MVLALTVVLLLLLLVFNVAEDSLILVGGEVNGQPGKLSLEIVSPLGSTLKGESLLGWQRNAGEFNKSGLNLNRDISFTVVLSSRVVLGPRGTDLDLLPADAKLVGLFLDQVNGDLGVGKAVQTTDNIPQGSDDLLLLDALLVLAVVLFTIGAGNAGALPFFTV